ncbi:MAG: DNA polymerase III subunit delta [Acetobacteraceae bacterium]
MKLSRSRIAAFLKAPGPVNVVLLYGGDAGLIGERARLLIRAVLGAADDPFRFATIGRAEDLPGEAVAIAFGGGRRVLRLGDAGEAAHDAVAAVLNGAGDALVVLEALGLVSSRSKLLKLIEGHPKAAAIACYPEEGEALEGAVRGWLAEEKVAADDEAISWLVARLGADRAQSRAEVEKLALYVGTGGRVDLAAAEAAVGDVAELSLDDALFAATEGAVALADRALERAIATGATPVGVIRAGLGHLGRLQRKELRPPLLFRRRESFARALRLWPAEILAVQIAAFFAGERAAKRTGTPDAALCRHLVLGLAQSAAGRAAPRGRDAEKVRQGLRP